MFDIYNRRYIGAKTKILEEMYDALKPSKVFELSTSFLDIFAGTGTVTDFFIKKNTSLSKFYVNDILYSNYIIYNAFFLKESFDIAKLEGLSKFLLSNNCNDNYYSQNFGGRFFSYNDALKIGTVRDNIDLLFKSSKINYKEYTILIASLLYSIDRIANTVGHYEAYIKKGNIPDRFDFIFIKPLPYGEKDISIYNKDALFLSERLQKTDIDIAFLDPPYNSRQYSRGYHLLDTVARNDKVELFGEAKKPKDFIKSSFSLSNATEEFSKLIENIKAKYIILTYNNTGNNANNRSNAKIADDDIISILSKKGTVDIYQIKHKAFSAGKSVNENNFERVFLCKVY